MPTIERRRPAFSHDGTVPLLIAIALVALVAWSANADFGPAVKVRAHTLRVGRMLLRYSRRAPATTSYLFVVTVTAWVLATSSEELDDALLRSHSSNIAALAQSPIRGLVQSAFWVDGGAMFILAWVLGLLLMPVERWIGTTRWIVVFALGHAVTTLVVAGIMWSSIRAGWVHSGVRHVVDVGVSYGFAAIAGLLTYRLTKRAARAYVGVAFGLLLGLLAIDRDFTSLGHLIAFSIGLACYPLIDDEAVRARAHTPYFAVGD